MPIHSPKDQYPQIPTLLLLLCIPDRSYVFHIEFDTHGTGLKYAIGEALGAHGWNDDAEGSRFL